MHEILDKIQILNTIKGKLIMLFSLLILITTCINLLLINIYVSNYHDAPPPVDTFIFKPGNMYDNSGYVAVIKDSIKAERESLRIAILTVSASLIIFQIFIATIGSYLIVTSALKPLSKLNERMKEINDLNLRSKIIKDNPLGEVGELIDNFNSMIEKIQLLVEKEKEFIQNISHELKTPITAVRANLESTLILGVEDKEIADTIKRGIQSLDSLTKLMNDLALLSSIEKKQVEIETFNAVQAVKDTVDDAKQAFNHNSQVTLNLEVKKANIKGSVALFKRAIYNLIENGIKYNQNKPEIVVTVKANENNLQINIKDNGIGIPQDKIKKIFERFYRIEESRSRNTGGSGLGLAITKEIIELFHGTTKVESDKTGTEFTLKFPLN